MTTMPLSEAARSLGVHPQTLRTQIKLGRLRATKLARDWFVTSDEVERYRAESLGRGSKGEAVA